MNDDMIYSEGQQSLRRGRRRVQRTETCRPCILWPVDAPDMAFQGVALDVSPYGMLVRMLDALPAGTEIEVQLMRDDQFREPMAPPIKGMVVRSESDEDGFVDHGIQLIRPPIKHYESRPLPPIRRRITTQPVRRTRMYTMDVSMDQGGTRRTRR